MLLSLPAEAQLQLELQGAHWVRAESWCGSFAGAGSFPGVYEPLAAACDPQFLVTTGYLWTMQCSRLGG